MELDERDIRVVASGRFVRRWRWLFLSYLALCIFPLGGVAFLGWNENLVYIPVVMILGGFGFWCWGADREGKKLVKEWKGE